MDFPAIYLINRRILARVNFINNDYMEACAKHSHSLRYYHGLKADKLLFASLAGRGNDSTVSAAVYFRQPAAAEFTFPYDFLYPENILTFGNIKEATIYCD